MKSIADYIHLINSSKSAPDAFNSFIKIMGDYGYEKVTYAFATDHPSIGLHWPHSLFSNFPEDWMKHYMKNNYVHIDPVVAHTLNSHKPIFWSDCGKSEGLSVPSQKLMREGADAGLKEGALVPLYSSTGEIAGLSVSTGETGREGNYADLAAISLLGVYFHESYKSFIKKVNVAELTRKECDILCWAAEGKTDGEIAQIIGKSLPTVRYHWNNIFKKLNAYGRVAAITKAIQMRLITPGVIRHMQ